MFAVATLSGLIMANPLRSSTLPALVLLGSGFLLQHALFLPKARRPRGEISVLSGLAALAAAFLAKTHHPAMLATAWLPPILVGLIALLVRRFDGPAKMDALPSNLAGALALAAPAWTLAILAGVSDREALVLWLLLALQGGAGVLLVQSRLPRPVGRDSLFASSLVAAGFGLLLPPVHGALWAALLLARPAAAGWLQGRTVRLRTLGRMEARLQTAGGLLLAHALHA